MVENPPPTPSTDAPAPIEVAAGAATVTETTLAPFVDGPLAEVCPATIAIQTAVQPGVAIGALYGLLGPEPAIDPTAQVVSAPLVRSDGTVEGVTLELRSGGPAVGFVNPIEIMRNDASVTLAHASLPTALVERSSLTTTAVLSLTARSHDAVVYDPASYPAVTDWDGLRSAEVEIRHVTGAPFVAYLEAQGVVTAGQLTPGFGGSPAGFVAADGAIAQQGDLIVDPVLFPTLAQWGRPVATLAAADAGWASLDDLLLVDADDERISDACLGRLVPVMQSAVPAYLDRPTETNELLVQVRKAFNPLDRLTVDLLDAGVASGIELGGFGPGTVGGFDAEALGPFLPELAGVLGIGPVNVDDVVTTRFIDPTIAR